MPFLRSHQTYGIEAVSQKVHHQMKSASFALSHLQIYMDDSIIRIWQKNSLSTDQCDIKYTVGTDNSFKVVSKQLSSWLGTLNSLILYVSQAISGSTSLEIQNHSACFIDSDGDVLLKLTKLFKLNRIGKTIQDNQSYSVRYEQNRLRKFKKQVGFHIVFDELSRLLQKYGETECPVCKEPILEEQPYDVFILKCNHLIHFWCHRNCLRNNKKNCPLCREPMQSNNF